MNKNSQVKLLFFIIFSFSVIFICFNKGKIDTDFLSIIQDTKIRENREIFTNLNKQLNKQIVFLVNDKKTSDVVINRLEKSNLFEKITFNANNNYLNFISDFNKSKLALFSRSDFEVLKKDPNAFFNANVKEFFLPIKKRVLSPNDDFFNFTKNGLKNDSSVYLDFKSNRLKTGSYFFINTTLKNGYSSNHLLSLVMQIEQLKSSRVEILMAGGAIYSALGKHTGESQSFYMSLASLGLSAFLLVFAFRRFSVLYIGLVAIFGFTFGLSWVLYFVKSLHIISIIISSSLVGLMYDFAIHWLSYNTKNTQVLPIKKMLKVFFIGLFLTTSGYAIFAFAPLDLLRQIAIFSIFALLGAFLCTYFLLPVFFENREIKANPMAINFINNYEKFMKKILIFLNYKTCIVAFVVFFIVMFFMPITINFKDDIKSYASTPTYWIEQAKKISQITNTKPQTRFLLLNSPEKEIELVDELKNKNALNNYNCLSKYFLTPNEQKELKEIFLRYSKDDDIIRIYTNLGFEKNMILNFFQNIGNLDILTFKDLINMDSFRHLGYLLNGDKNLIYIDTNEENIKKISKKYDAVYYDLVGSLNSSFENIKNVSIKLKIISFIVAFIFLAFFYGFRKSFIMIFAVLTSALFTIFLLSLFGFNINIFSIFGLILASAVGVDYMIFALNEKLTIEQKIFGIFLASSTTMLSFLILTFSTTTAVKIFGLSVGLSVGLSAFFASILSLKINNIDLK